MTGHRQTAHRNGCRSGKYAFPSRREARKRLRVLKERGVDVEAVYKCEHCGEWHLTHYTKEQTREFARKRREEEQ